MKYDDLEIGDIIELKKDHPSKTKQWELIKMGSKFKFRSTIKFDLFIELDRITMNRYIKKIIKKGE